MSINIGDLLGSLTGGGKQQQQPQQQSGGGGGGQTNLIASLLPALLPMLANGGLTKILGGLQSKGLTEQVDSWKGEGSNEMVSPEDIKDVMGSDQLDELAQKAGVSPDEAASAISQVLPGLVDKVSHGDLPKPTPQSQTETETQTQPQAQPSGSGQVDVSRSEDAGMPGDRDEQSDPGEQSQRDDGGSDISEMLGSLSKQLGL